MDAVCSDYSTAFQFDYIRLRIETKRNIFHLPYGFDQNHWNVSSNSLRLECVCEVYHTIWIFIWNVIDKKTYSKFFCSNCEPTLPKQGRKLNILFPVWHLCVCVRGSEMKWNEFKLIWSSRAAFLTGGVDKNTYLTFWNNSTSECKYLSKFKVNLVVP